MQSVCVYFEIVFLIVVLSKIAYATSSLTVHKSAVVLVGERVEMNCSVTGSDLTRWMYTSWNTSHETRIYLNTEGNIVESMRSRYNIDKRISGQHNLIIDSVDLAHAGRYRCNGATQGTLWSDVLLTVLGSRPVCAANTTEAHIDRKKPTQLAIWCSVFYTGNRNCIFNWTKTDEQKNIATITTHSGTNQVPITSTFSISVQLCTNDSEVTFQFWITFNTPSKTSEYLSNTYEYIWNYSLYGPRNLGIVEYADRLECSADGNPIPIYKWTNLETNISTDEPIYLLNGTNDSETTLECTATNIFASKNKNYTIKVDKCTVKDPGGTQDPAGERPGGLDIFVTALAIGGSLLLLLIIAVIVSCVVCRKGHKDDASARPDVALHTCMGLTSNDSGADKIADNAVYAQVMKPKGPSKGNKGGNVGKNSRPQQAPKDVTGADGTVYAELSGVKPPERKGKAQVPKTPAFNKVEIYASIDHCGNASAPPLPSK